MNCTAATTAPLTQSSVLTSYILKGCAHAADPPGIPGIYRSPSRVYIGNYIGNFIGIIFDMFLVIFLPPSAIFDPRTPFKRCGGAARFTWTKFQLRSSHGGPKSAKFYVFGTNLGGGPLLESLGCSEKSNCFCITCTKS